MIGEASVGLNRPLLSVQDVGLRYRKRKSFFRHAYYEALSSVSLDVFQGETLGIVGRNGCGKSTLLRLMAGIFTPDSGVIETNNATVSLLTLAAGFDPELSGRDNIFISSLLLGATKAETNANLEKVAAFSELGFFIDEPVKTYSSGMKMRLGFSIAICMEPDVLLIDEVLGVGDLHFKQKAEAAIVDKITSEQTVVLVSHAGEQIKRLCSRAIWLEDGSVKMQGNAKEVVDKYEKWLTEEDASIGKTVTQVAL